MTTSASCARRTRTNPGLLLVTGNPRNESAERRRERLERAWCHFHQRERFDGSVTDVGPVPGAPATAFVLGRLVAIDLGDGEQEFAGGAPFLCASPDDDSLWIVARDTMNLAAQRARAVTSVTYDPVRTSGKDRAHYRHDFHAPRPTLAPIGGARSCRAALLDGGRYYVTDWIHE